jgi:hypothetical protein
MRASKPSTVGYIEAVSVLPRTRDEWFRLFEAGWREAWQRENTGETFEEWSSRMDRETLAWFRARCAART